MRAAILSSAVLLSALSLVQAQTFTDCDPTKKSCPADPALGTTLTTDFKNGKSKDWEYAEGTTLSYDAVNGAAFNITSKHEAPTISSEKYIFFGKVSAYVKASPGTGIVSSFILESDDLDEIDWEWLGSDNGNVQTNFFGKGDVSTYDRSSTVPVQTPIDTFHTYTIDWTAERIVWSIDNNPVRTLTYNDPTAHQGTRYPQTPMKIKMGNWIGCLDASDPATKGTCDWAGGQAVFPSDSTTYQMFVQTVTIEDYGCASEYSYGDLSGSWQSIKSSGSCDGNNSNDDSSSSTSPSSTSSSVKQTSTGGVFAESSTSSSAPSSTSKSSTKASSSTAESTKVSVSTLSTATVAIPSKTASSGASPATTSTSGTTTPTVASNDGNSSKSKYGVLDYAVIVLGLGLGYLVM